MTRNGAVNLLILDPGKKPSNTLREAAVALHLANRSPQNGGPITQTSSSPKRIIKSIKEKLSGVKRRASTSPLDNAPVKRVRGGDARGDSDGDEEGADDIICLGSSSSAAKPRAPSEANLLVDALDPLATLKFVRVNMSTLR